MALWRSDWTVRNTVGTAIPNASVFWVTQPTTSTTTVPPSPLAAVALSATGTPSIANNPQTTNGYGQATGYLAAGTYTVVEVWNGVIQQVYPDQAIGIANAGGTVTSIGLTMPAGFLVSNSPITASGTIAVTALPSAQPYINILNYNGSAGAAKGQRLGATMSQGSPTITITSGDTYTFATDGSEVNKQIKVVGAGSNGGDLYTTIASVTNATTATLNANAGTAVSGTTVVWWTSGQETIDRTALNNAIAAATDLLGIVYTPGAFYLYDTTPTWGTTGFQGMIGTGIRNTFWCASNANAGSFFAPSGTAPRWETFGGNGQGFSVYGPGYIAASIITNVALTSNVVTFTCNNNFVAGQTVVVQLLTSATGKALNNQILTVLSSGLSSSQFTANYTHADITSVPDGGIAYVQESAFLINSNGLWFGSIQEIEIYGFQGNGIQMTKPILNNWQRLWVHNCGAMGFNFFVQPPTAVGATGTTLTTCYALGCYGPGFFFYYNQEGVLNNCYSESNGGGFIFDFCQGMVMNGCAVEQPAYRNTTLPGKFVEMRTCRSCVWNGGFMIMDSGGNVAQTYIALNTNGTTGSACQQNTFFHPYLTTSGNTPTYLVAFEDSTCDWNSVIEPFWTSGNLITGGLIQNLGVGNNNSVIYKGIEGGEGMNQGKFTSNAGNAAITVATPSAATNGANKNSPDVVLSAAYFDGAASQLDKLKIRSLPNSTANNPVMDLDFSHTGSSGGWQITVGGTPAISSSVQWLGGGNTSSKFAQGTINTVNSPAVTGPSNFAISAGWGATSTLTLASACTNSGGRFSIACTGTGESANPTITFTYATDAGFAATPVVVFVREDISTPTTGYLAITAIDGSHWVATFVGTPVDGTTYHFAWLMLAPRG